MPVRRLAVLLLCVCAAPAHAAWRPISPAANASVCNDGAGRLWILSHHDELAIWPLAERGWPDCGAAWTTHHLPAGFRGLHLAVAGDTAFVSGCFEYHGRHTVFRGVAGPDGAMRWEEQPVAAIGILFGMAVDARGEVWLGSERGEIFHRTERGWAKEVAPLPIHCRSLHVSGGGQLWAWGQTRGRSAIFFRDDATATWRVAKTFPTGNMFPCRFEDDAFIVQREDDLLRFRRGSADPEWTVPLPPGSSVAMDSPETGWVLREGAAARLLPGGSLEPIAPPPFPPDRFPRVVDGRLVSCSPSMCWVSFPDPEPEESPGALGMIPRRHPDSPPYGHPTHGIAVLETGGATYAYLTQYTEPDRVVPIRGAPVPGDATARFGIDRLEEGLVPDPIYRTTALAADLNADGREDLLVSSMYDGCRVLRNRDDERFTGWTRESGLGGRGDAIVEDTELLDADGDGDLDVFVVVLHEADRLYLNDGAAGFHEATATGMQSGAGSVSATAADLERDGDTDLLVATWGHGLRVHENLGRDAAGPRFRTHVLLSDIEHPDVPGGLARRNLSAVAVGDLDGDARPEIVATVRAGAPILLRNHGELRFTEAPGAFPADPADPTTGALELLDADNDGDLDVFAGGHGGTRQYENRDGTFSWTRPQDWDERAKRGTPSIMGLAAVDADGDGDLDLLEAGDPGSLLIHENTGPVDGIVTVVLRGPPGNRTAIGARVELYADGAERPAATAEVPGGTGAGSHRTRTVVFTGLPPGAAYTVMGALPSGELGTRRVAVPGRVELPLAPQGAAGHLRHARAMLAARALDHWNVRFALLTAAMLVAVLLVQAGRTRAHHRPVRHPWLPAAVTVLLAVAVRVSLGDPGGTAALGGALAGGAAGLLALAVLPLGRDTGNVELLAELSMALQAFDHNQTPRRMLDRIRFLAANFPAADTPENTALVTGALDNLRGTVLPEFRAVVAKARAAGLGVGVGGTLLAMMTRRADAAAELARRGAGTRRLAAEVPALAAQADTFVQWTRSLRKEVDAAVASPLDELIARFAESRAREYPVSFRLEVAPARVRLPETEAMRVLDVLLENSLRAVERGLEITVRLESVRASRARLIFADNGPGIPEADRDKVFERHFTRFAGGSGFGLYAALRTVRRFGGDLRLDEDGAPGARFVLELEAV